MDKEEEVPVYIKTSPDEVEVGVVDTTPIIVEGDIILTEKPVAEATTTSTETAKCLNCENDATVEEADTHSAFCGPKCQEIYRQPALTCQVIRTRHTIHTMDDDTLKVAPHIEFRVVRTTETPPLIEVDLTNGRVIRIEAGVMCVNIHDNDDFIVATYCLRPNDTDCIVVPRTLRHSIVAHVACDTARLSIVQTQ